MLLLQEQQRLEPARNVPCDYVLRLEALSEVRSYQQLASNSVFPLFFRYNIGSHFISKRPTSFEKTYEVVVLLKQVGE